VNAVDWPKQDAKRLIVDIKHPYSLYYRLYWLEFTPFLVRNFRVCDWRVLVANSSSNYKLGKGSIISRYKSLYSSTRTPKFTPKTPISNTRNLLSAQTFQYIVNWTSGTSPNRVVPSPKWRVFFFRVKGGSSLHVNLRQLFQRWKIIFTLLFNLFYYNISIIYFGNNFFNTETSALNWSNLKSYPNIFRYVQQFLTYKVGFIFNEEWLVGRYLRSVGFSVSFILDLFFHKKTLYSLKRSGFETIALVPMNYNPLIVGIAIPLAQDSFTVQLIFIRLVLHIRKSVAQVVYSELFKLWTTFKISL